MLSSLLREYAAPACCIALLAGCGPSWHKAGATAADLDRDSRACRMEAELGTPLRDKDAPVMQQRMDVSGHLAIYEDLQTACLRRMGWQD